MPRSSRSTKSSQTSKKDFSQHTLIYVHGMLNKPAASVLKDQWDRALFGVKMGERTHMAYWADIRYPQPLSSTTVQSLEQEYSPMYSVLSQDEFIDDMVARVNQGAEARAFARALASRMLSEQRPALMRSIGKSEYHAQVNFPDWFTRWFVRTFTPDVAAYFFDKDQRRRIQERFRMWLTSGPGPFVVVAHSLGSIVAYDVLREFDSKGAPVPLLVTLGSPLGLEEIQQRVKKPLSVPSQVTHWHNFAARFDVVAIDRNLSGEFTPKSRLTDHFINTTGLFDNPHDVEGYLHHPDVRATVAEAVGHRFADPTASFVIAKDLVGDMQGSVKRTPVLIELSSQVKGKTLDEKRQLIQKKLSKLTRDPDAAVEPLRRFVAARLTSPEIMALRAKHEGLAIRRMWRDSIKRKVLDKSTSVLHSQAAHESYAAQGEGINWAILDTGIRADHPHFKEYANVKAQWDCTKTGAPKPGAKDGDGHGTHVAGIIAGSGSEKKIDYRSNAPRAGLHIYKVLSDDGEGQDSWIIKALDHIAELNESSPELVIHGVNLSLGGPFETEVYGCGFSPLCTELRRLWQQGVLVCIAAGNEGRLVLRTTDGIHDLNMDLSIGDPANLEEAIAVGSVHRESPHLYGVSYFSSRGPTADGRRKPDVVAPGEKIMSANASFEKEDLYVAMSGTSMACPQVSGVLAAFLSVRREFVGRPDMVKRLLLDHCVDLGRDPNFQGAGVPNLMQMLLST